MRTHTCTPPVPLERGATHAVPMEEPPPQLLTHLEPELLRGVSLHECLSGFGKHWRQPDAGMSNVSHSNYELSRAMEYFDDFLSHDWGTSRWLKVVSMLIIYNSRAALVAMLVTAIALVPTWWSHVPGCKSDHLVLHQRFMVVGICHGVHLLFLCFWQRFRSLLFTPQFAFLDKLCIAQSPELADLKAKGILGLAAFMKHSKRLVATGWHLLGGYWKNHVRIPGEKHPRIVWEKI